MVVINATDAKNAKNAANAKRQYDIINVGDIGKMSIKHINRLISENEFCFDQNKFFHTYS